jgi:hypothetical protein
LKKRRDRGLLAVKASGVGAWLGRERAPGGGWLTYAGAGMRRSVMSRAMWAVVFAALATAGIGRSETYWIAWEGDDWPENMDPPWIRAWGNWQGPGQGGAYRTLENGILTYDSLYDPGVYDWYYIERPGQLDPGPGEVFLAWWSVWTEQVVGYPPYDPGLSVQSDEARGVGVAFNDTTVFSVYEQKVLAYIEPGQFHDFGLWSADMHNYQLDIDGEEAATGVFQQGVSASWVGWGDCAQGAASLHHWDFVRLGVLVAPLTGDTNCDGTFDFGDINPFVQVLSDPGGYANTYPMCWPGNGDMNRDGTVDFGDINPFVELLTGGR